MEKLYRIKTKPGTHLCEKTKKDGWFKALQFDKDNHLNGPSEAKEISLWSIIIPSLAIGAIGIKIIEKMVSIIKREKSKNKSEIINKKLKTVNDYQENKMEIKNLDIKKRKVPHTSEEVINMIIIRQNASKCIKYIDEELANTIIINNTNKRYLLSQETLYLSSTSINNRKLPIYKYNYKKNIEKNHI